MKTALLTSPVTTLIAVCLLQAGASSIAAAEPGATGATAGGVAAVAASNASAARANKSKPLEPAIRDAVRALVSTSHRGLVEEKTGRGVEMKLKGRFRTAPVATLEDDGAITIRDYTSVPATE